MALVTSPLLTAERLASIFDWLSSNDASGLYSRSAVIAWGIVLLWTTVAGISVMSAACSAAIKILPLFGKTIACLAPLLLIASAISWMLGFIVCPPLIIWVTPRLFNSLAIPSPDVTAITAVSGLGLAASRALSIGVSERSASSSSCSIISSCCQTMLWISMVWRSPNCWPHDKTSPGCSVWTWTRTTESSFKTRRLSPILAR